MAHKPLVHAEPRAQHLSPNVLQDDISTDASLYRPQPQSGFLLARQSSPPNPHEVRVLANNYITRPSSQRRLGQFKPIVHNVASISRSQATPQQEARCQAPVVLSYQQIFPRYTTRGPQDRYWASHARYKMRPERSLQIQLPTLGQVSQAVSENRFVRVILPKRGVYDKFGQVELLQEIRFVNAISGPSMHLQKLNNYTASFAILFNDGNLIFEHDNPLTSASCRDLDRSFRFNRGACTIMTTTAVKCPPGRVDSNLIQATVIISCIRPLIRLQPDPFTSIQVIDIFDHTGARYSDIPNVFVIWLVVKPINALDIFNLQWTVLAILNYCAEESFYISQYLNELLAIFKSTSLTISQALIKIKSCSPFTTCRRSILLDSNNVPPIITTDI